MNCPICHTPKVESRTPGGLYLGMVYPCSCAYDAEIKREAESRKLREDVAARAVVEETERRLSRLPAEHAERLRTGNFDGSKIHPDILKIQETGNWKQNLLLLGPSFSGKTFDLAWIIKSCQIDSFYFLSPDQVLDVMWGRHESISKEALLSCVIFVLDDCDKFNNETERSEIFDLIDLKWKSRQHIWITANSTEDQLRLRLGAPAWNRLKKKSATIIKTGKIESKED
jgi:DNA replication protein DnaC